MNHPQKHHVAGACAEGRQGLVHKVKSNHHEKNRGNHNKHRVILDIRKSVAPYRERKCQVAQEVHNAGNCRRLCKLQRDGSLAQGEDQKALCATCEVLERIARRGKEERHPHRGVEEDEQNRHSQHEHHREENKLREHARGPHRGRYAGGPRHGNPHKG